MIPGVDVAKYQPTNPDPASTVPNIQFYFAKATEGTTVDPTYAAHVAHARSAHIPVIGAYHFGVNMDAKQQLDAFLKAAGNVQAFALDVEGSNPMTENQARYFLAGLKNAGHRAILYHSESGFPHWGQDLNWVAKYSSKQPVIPWNFWQYGPAAHNVDGDRFNGTTNQMLKALGLQINTTYLMAYIRLWVPLYNRLGQKTTHVVHSGTRLKIGPMQRFSNGLHYYRILDAAYAGLFLHAGDPRFTIYRVPANA